MEFTILGTAAAEGWPAPFCVCVNCETARRRGGANIRTRSGALIDDDIKVDFNGDTVMQMQRSGRNLSKLRTIIFTHDHSDHFAVDELEWAKPPFTQTPPESIAVFANERVHAVIRKRYADLKKCRLDLRPMRPLEPTRTPTGDTLLPMPADHCEDAMVFALTRGGKTLFYGHDSGLYPEATLNALSKLKLDIAIFDCTNGGLKTENRGHMGVDGVSQMAAELKRRGAVTSSTRLIATHFSHNGKLMHEDLVAAFLPQGIEVAYDGITIRV